MKANVDKLGDLVRGLEKLRHDHKSIIDLDAFISVPIDMAIKRTQEKYERVRDRDNTPLPEKP